MKNAECLEGLKFSLHGINFTPIVYLNGFNEEDKGYVIYGFDIELPVNVEKVCFYRCQRARK